MPNVEQFAFAAGNGGFGEASLLPQLPVTLSYRDQWVITQALLDTGATVNVMPYKTGEQLGAVWDESTDSIRMSGNLAQYEAKPLVVTAALGSFETVRLAFAWTRAENVPLIFGQVNFLWSLMSVSIGRKGTLRYEGKDNDGEGCSSRLTTHLRATCQALL